MNPNNTDRRDRRNFTCTFGVAGALIENDRKILLVLESKGPDAGKWNHPAGLLEIGEHPVSGVQREVEEETGFAFSPSAVLGLYSFVRPKQESSGVPVRHPLKIIFLGTLSVNPVRKLADDISEIQWFSPEEIYAMDSATLRDEDIK